jgi:glyoxylate carboligase
MRTERPVKRTRVYEGMAAAFASDGVMWTAMGREEPAGVHMPRVTVMGRNGR